MASIVDGEQKVGRVDKVWDAWDSRAGCGGQRGRDETELVVEGQMRAGASCKPGLSCLL